MNDLATLVTAITGLVTAVTGLIGGIFLLVRSGRREREQAAPTVADEIAEAAADGDLTTEEIVGILRKRGDLK